MNYDSLQDIQKLISKYDGNHSVICHYIKDKITKMNYDNEELPFMYEFLFFEFDYLKVKEFMLLNSVEKPIVDIGCQYGFQSELFLKQGYTGIEVFKDMKWFNVNEKKVKYIQGSYPTVDIKLKGKIAISNMSLSWFDNEVPQEDIISKLKEADILYFRGKDSWKEEIQKHYKYKKTLSESQLGDSDFAGIIYWR